MRVLVTGVDGQGRSCVVSETSEVSHPFDDEGITVSFTFATTSCPPPRRPPGRAELVGVARTPGTAQWSFTEFPPNVATRMHHTDSVDLDVVIEGSVDVVLDDGPHRLGPGDGVVINGVDHGWATHEEGCRMSVVVIATPPLDK